MHHCGSRAELAQHLGISTSYVDKLRTLDEIPAKHCYRLHLLTHIPMHRMNSAFPYEYTLCHQWEVRLIRKLRVLWANKRTRELVTDFETMVDLE